jgi:hypothetical protein
MGKDERIEGRESLYTAGVSESYLYSATVFRNIYWWECELTVSFNYPGSEGFEP